MTTALKYTYFLLITFIFTNVFAQKKTPSPTCTVKITFKNVVKDHRLVLNDSIYTNPSGENYTVSKCRYYISNVKLNARTKSIKEPYSYHLIDQSKPESQTFIIKAPAGEYNSLTFLVGVDSLHNVSGAQSGALDPLNDMFWTWNTGYVMAKLEGYSPASGIQNNIFEYHIGGFKGANNVLRTITLNFPGSKTILLSKNAVTEITINANINEWWQGEMDLRIAKNASINSPGVQAKMISGNYAKMFSIQGIGN